MDTQDKTRNQQQTGASTSSSQQQGGGTSSPTQQDQYSPGSTQQGGGVTSRPRAGLPSLWPGRSPFELMRQLDEDMDRLWGQLWGGRGRNLSAGARGAIQQTWMPQLEVFERDGKFHVHADLPGMRKEDIKLNVEQEQLVISGERRSHHEEGERDKGGYWHSERSYGSFYRTVQLPEGVDPATAQANFKDGVLDVSFDAPKRPPLASRSIEIR
jgi:HSP20 family protein